MATTISDLSGRAGELKSQGAMEAARSPNSSVTAEDAEQKILEEAKRGGSSAFRFNPDASPQEKAAQAHAVGSMCPFGLRKASNELTFR